MDSVSLSRLTTVLLLVLLTQLLVSSCKAEGVDQKCPAWFDCSPFGRLSYPFTTTVRPDCGVYAINCTDTTPTMGLTRYNLWFDVLHSSSNNNSFLLGDPFLLHSVSCDCDVFDDDPRRPLVRRLLEEYCPGSLSVKVMLNQTLWKCPKRLMTTKNMNISNSNNESFRLIHDCDKYDMYQSHLLNETTYPNCTAVQYPRFLVVELSDKCLKCVTQGGRCQDRNNGQFHCIKTQGRKKLTLVGLGILGGILGFVILVLILKKVRKIKVKLRRGRFGSRSMSGDTAGRNSKMYFSLPIFSYEELEEATNHFDSSMELGDGGFGTVYYGKLKDGREVAVKRFYERNYRRLEQFMNEIEILNCLRHQNLVSLYGCTSRHSTKGLLLVYEYLPNGTVADHLHGDRSKCGTLTWAVRLRIAVETARALSYLHASDIIHRDVKTNNILLDNNFGVKVADFGLSRLFPTDVTHVSTVPQGTPGYLDPEYHQCYQLTGKSDVYSFGVVLLEIISSLPAVDVGRNEDEINLSSYAMKRIQSGAIGELVDPRLGFESDSEVRRMTTLVAEIAFRCLQHKKEFRPTMDEVLQDLINIESADINGVMVIQGPKEEEQDEEKNYSGEKSKITQTEADYSSLLKGVSKNPPSPKSVIHKWSSIKSITPAPSL